MGSGVARRCAALALALVVGGLVTATASAAGFMQQQKLTASDAASSDNFGVSGSVSSDGSTALIGAFGKNSSTGAAYVFTRSGSSWSQEQELTAGDGASSDEFGWSVSLSGDGSTALIGAFSKNGDTGAAYVFTRSASTWSEQAELTASDGASGDVFGWSVSLSSDGNTALLGAEGKNSSTGTAYVFTRSGSTWSPQQELTASDGATNEYFGYRVSLSGDGSTALIGGFGKSSSTGAAYVFTRSGSTWSQQQELTASDGASGDSFGESVSLSGDGGTALIGAQVKNSVTGAAYVFTRSGSTWSQQQELTASDGASNDSFGDSGEMTGHATTALIGAEGNNSNTGAAYVFALSGSTWSQEQELTAGDGASSDNFGSSVSLSGDGSTALIGASFKNSNMGAAYVFASTPPNNVPESPWVPATALAGVVALGWWFRQPRRLGGSATAF